MKICLVCVEIFAWGKFGGFGRSTRMLGRELARLGIEVTAVVPRRNGQGPVEMLDGIRVMGFEPGKPWTAVELFRAADADIYHSQEPSLNTFLAQRAMPSRNHIVTFRDTRNLKDWWLEFVHPSLNHIQVLGNYFYEDNIFVQHAVRRAQRCFVAARFLAPKARQKYRLTRDPEFLPSPIPFPDRVQKSETPLVCFVGRFDRRKRPEKFLQLAEKFPDVRFVAAGAGRDRDWDRHLRESFGDLPNLEFTGFLDQFSGSALTELLGQSWILVNTSVREGLPTSFLEAAAHGCAILGGTDPDGFASRFGFHVRDDDYAAGLTHLLAGDRWLGLGQQARAHVGDVFSLERSVQRHLQIYEELIAHDPRDRFHQHS